MMIDLYINDAQEINVSDIKTDDIVTVIIEHKMTKLESWSWDLAEKNYQETRAYQMVYQSNLNVTLLDTEVEEYNEGDTVFKEVTNTYEVSKDPASSFDLDLINEIVKDPYADQIEVVAGEATRYDSGAIDKDICINADYTAKRVVKITVTLNGQETDIDYAGLRPTSGTIQSGIYHHGAAAVYYTDGVQKNIENIILGKVTGAICACDKEYIGNIGVDITGQVTLAAVHNLFSNFNRKTQKRTFSTQYAHYVYTCEEDKPQFLDDLTVGQHSEFWIEHATVKSLWVVKGTPEEAVAEKLAAKYSLPLKRISKPNYTYKLA